MNFDNKKFGSIYRVAKFIGYSETEINNTKIMNNLYDGLSNIEEIIYHDLEFEVRISSGEPPVKRIYYMESLFTFYENYVSKEKLTDEIGLSAEQIYIIENSLIVKNVKLGERLNQIYFKGNNLSMICRHYDFSKFTDSFLILKATSLSVSLTQENITKFEEELNVIIDVFLGQEFINSYFFFYYLHNILIRYKYPSNIYSDVLSKLVNAETTLCQELLKKYNKNLEITFYAIADKIFISKNDFIRMMELEKYRSVEEICNQLRLDKSEVFKSLFNIGYIDKYNSILIVNDKVKKTNLGLYIHSSLVEEIFFENYFSDDQVDDLIAKNISLFNENDIKYISYNSKNYIHVEAYKKLYYIIKASNDDYIYINEVLELKEVNSLIDVSKIRKSRFQQQLSKLIMPEYLISYDYIRHKKLCRLPKVFSKAKVTIFFKELVKKEDLCSKFNISAENVELIIQKCDVKCYRFLKECISNLYNFEEFNSKMFISDGEKFVSIKVISKRFYGKSFVNNSFELNLANSIKKVGENIISFKKLEKPMFDIKDSCVVEYLYNLSEFEEFFNKLIPFDYVVDKLQIQAINLTLNLKKLKIEPVILGNATDKFIYKDLVKVIKTLVEANKKPLTYVEFAEKNNCVTLSFVEEKLKISKKISSQLIKNNKIKIICKYNGIYLINRENLEALIEEKQLFLDQMKNVYITYTGIEKLYGKSFAKKIPKHNGAKGINLDKREIPLIAKDIYLKNNYIYRRDEVYRVWKKSYEYEELNSVTINDHFENFKNKVENVFKVNFTEKQQSSKKLWYEYVQHLLIKMNLCDKRRENHRINQLAYNTREIFSEFSDEIFNYSSQEINKIYLDDKSLVKVTYKQDFYSFLKSLYRSFLLKKKHPVFKIDKLINPESKKCKKEKNKDIYSYYEYKEIYKYCANIELHKSKSLNDIGALLTNKNNTKYYRYASAWAYCIVLLTNAWRRNTILTQIPRIDLSGTRICNLEWLENNTPSLEEANSIIYEIGRYITYINKNKVNQESIFIIGEPLKIPFAIAASICELTKQRLVNDEPFLLNLSNDFSHESKSYKIFFEMFKSDIILENRKMNRTLESFYNSIYSDNGEGLKTAKYARGHKRIETTIEHYVILTDEEIDELILTLFERGNFGFAYKIIAETLYGEFDCDKKLTNKIVELKETFGDIDKLEATCGVINRLSYDQQEAREYIKKLELNELRELYNRAIAGLLNSNLKNYQCILKRCKYIDEMQTNDRCKACSYAIINIYALSNIMDNYIYLLEFIKDNYFSINDGEKKKIANHLYLLNNKVMEARELFGRNVVDGFVNGGTNRIKELGSEINSFGLIEYRTSGVLLRSDD